MIIITNNKEKISLDESQLKKDKNKLNFVGVDKYCEIVLSFVLGRRKLKKGITKIQKCQSTSGYGAGDMIKEYSNEVFSKDEIVLNNNDFNEVKKLIKSMNTSLDSKLKEVIIESIAVMMAFEIYRYILIDDFDYKDDFDVIFEYVSCDRLYYSEKLKYKKDIIKKAIELLKEEYNINLDYVLDGGNKNE